MEMPQGILIAIANFLPMDSLKQFHRINRFTFRSRQIHQRIFKLRLADNVNCRPFITTQKAELLQAAFKLRMLAESVDIVLANQTYECYFHDLKDGNYRFGYAEVFFSKNELYIRATILVTKMVEDIKQLTIKAKQLYPYSNIKKKDISSSLIQSAIYTAAITIIYVSVPEKYITIEQFEHDMIEYYHILINNDLIY